MSKKIKSKLRKIQIKLNQPDTPEEIIKEVNDKLGDIINKTDDFIKKINGRDLHS